MNDKTETEQIPDLYSLAFMPGNFRCPKCGFQLSKVTLNPVVGKVGISEENRQTEQCPNDGEWMTPLTYKEAFESQADILQKLFSSGVGPIYHERMRQIHSEGWTIKHDDGHNRGELATAGACYAFVAGTQEQTSIRLYSKQTPNGWPWESQWWKPSDDPKRNLEKAGALIAAEIERLEREERRESEA